VGAQNHAAVFLRLFVGDEKGVLHVAGGMVGGDVEGFEVVVFGFHFGAVGDLEAELGEDFFDFFLNLGKWVNVADLWAFGLGGWCRKMSLPSWLKERRCRVRKLFL
jgi:hypothetical protein